MRFHLALLGCGNMGSAITSRLLKNGFPAAQLFVHDVHPEKIQAFLAAGCSVLNLKQWTEQVAVVLLAVKPQSMSSLLQTLATHSAKSRLLISIAAGASLDTLAKPFNLPMPIIRAMPNTPALIGKGITALIGNAETAPLHHAYADFIFQTLGSVVWLKDEEEINAVTALSGSGPAYLFTLIDAMEQAGVRLGLNQELAQKLARETGIGAMELLHSTQKNPRELLQQVCSKGGTTEAALHTLTDANFTEILYRAMYAAYQRARTFT